MDRPSGLSPKASVPSVLRSVATERSVNPVPRKVREFYAKYTEITGKRSWVYVLVSIWVVGWAIAHLCFVTYVLWNTMLFLSYYVANYEFGFVRRGLVGEFIRILPNKQYFTGAYVILFASIAVWLVALMWLCLSTGARSERRIMLALTVPVLPFSFTYAVYNPHPELFAMTALLAFSMSLTRVSTPRLRMILSAVYGIAIAVLALIHEAIPLLFALGAILAILVLARDATHAVQRICVALAVVPGIVVVVLVAEFGRRDVGARLCAKVPHGMVDDPWAAIANKPQKALDYVLESGKSKSDYHDWICRNLTPTMDVDLTAAIRSVSHYGFAFLSESLILGLLIFTVTIGLIRFLSGVPIIAFLKEIRGDLILPVLGLALLIPLFVAAVDWSRWWILISFDVAIVYILYAITRPEIEQPPSRRTVFVFACFVMVLAVIPTGTTNNVGTY